jgi:hypothetical protein
MLPLLLFQQREPAPYCVQHLCTSIGTCNDRLCATVTAVSKKRLQAYVYLYARPFQLLCGRVTAAAAFKAGYRMHVPGAC